VKVAVRRRGNRHPGLAGSRHRRRQIHPIVYRKSVSINIVNTVKITIQLRRNLILHEEEE
jgi:hypothetical protein